MVLKQNIHAHCRFLYLVVRYKTSWTGIYKILWGSIFQGCYGQGKVRGKQIIFKVGQKSGKIFDIMSVRNNSANSITLHSKSWKWKGLESEDWNIDGLQKKPKQM